MRIMILLVLLLTAVRPVSAAGESAPLGLNCGYWNTALAGDAAAVVKVLFVRGMYEGATALYADIFDVAERAPQPEQTQATVAVVAGLFEQRYFRNTSYLVLVEGVDNFCKDSRNDSVWLSGAIKIVSMQLRAESTEVIEAAEMRLREEPGP